MNKFNQGGEKSICGKLKYIGRKTLRRTQVERYFMLLDAEVPGRLQSMGLQSWTKLKRLSMHAQYYTSKFG